MKKKLLLLGITATLILLGIAGLAQATLIIIGTASYGGTDYNLIYDDDDTGHGDGGLAWLDYTHSYDNWANQVNWASGLGASLAVTLNSGYTTDIDWATGWRLPDTVDGAGVTGYEGDPDNDGVYSYTKGYNLSNSEMGHLFYTELGNTGYRNIDGSYNSLPPAPEYFLQNTGDFDNLIAWMYWSSTEYVSTPGPAWYFGMHSGGQYYPSKSNEFYGLAVRSGQVSAVPIPGAIWLLGSGLPCLVAFGRRRKGNRV